MDPFRLIIKLCYNSTIATFIDFLNMANIIEFLDSLGKKINEKYNSINRGGCCVYAAIITEHLKKKGVPARGIVASYSAGPYSSIAKARKNRNLNSVKECDNEGISLSHVGVEFIVDGVRYHYDSNGVNKASDRFDMMPIYRGRLNLKEMQALADSPYGWNKRFDRSKIKSLKKFVSKEFESLAV